MKRLVRLLLLLILQATLLRSVAQQDLSVADSFETKTLQLREVIICDQPHGNANDQASNFYKPNRLSTTEDILARMMGVSLMKRGAYGLEPVLRVYSAGQINLTINGMRIYGACTDKMDPATSYIEPNNLQNISTKQGAAGNENGSTVGGEIDMVMKQAEFSHCHSTYLTANVSYNSINNAVNAGTSLNMSFDKVAFRINGTYRKAFDYKAGGNKRVPHSAYEKSNYGASLAFRLPKEQKLVADYVGDMGWNIGYPALAMDAGKASANIASLTHFWNPASGNIQNVETKIYFNHIYHAMDDTHRENVAMHMDMPGWSYTLGAYTHLNLQAGKRNNLKVRADYASNFSKAEMTMYPVGASPMFMLTLPDNQRHFAGVYVADVYAIAPNQSIQFSARAEYMRASITSNFGISQAKIFDAEAGQPIHRFVPSVNAIYTATFAKYFSSGVTVAYGERSANANELFGFYLYNRFDGYDYLGNAPLKNERSLQAEWNGGFESKYVNVNYTVYYHHLFNYMMGSIQKDFYPMTDGALGVKKYSNRGQARIAGVEAKIVLNETKGFQSLHTLKYSYAELVNGEPLPLVPPLKCFHTLRYTIKGWYLQVEGEWALAQKRVNTEAGEQTTPAYGLLHLRTGYKLNLNTHFLSINFAVENVLDKNYREHLDWGNISRPGRNMVLSLSYAFNR